MGAHHFMPLLRSLAGLGCAHYYKHGAPNGACARLGGAHCYKHGAPLELGSAGRAHCYAINMALLTELAPPLVSVNSTQAMAFTAKLPLNISAKAGSAL